MAWFMKSTVLEIWTFAKVVDLLAGGPTVPTSLVAGSA